MLLIVFFSGVVLSIKTKIFPKAAFVVCTPWCLQPKACIQLIVAELWYKPGIQASLQSQHIPMVNKLRPTLAQTEGQWFLRNQECSAV